MVLKDSDATLISHMLLLALQDADACISLQPSEEGGYLSKAHILRHIGEVTQARALCQEGLRRVPTSVHLPRVAAAMEGESDYDEAAELKKMLENGIRERSAHDNSHDHSHSHGHGHPVDGVCPEHAAAAAAAAPKTCNDALLNECMHCGQAPAPKLKLLLCSACKSVSYCGESFCSFIFCSVLLLLFLSCSCSCSCLLAHILTSPQPILKCYICPVHFYGVHIHRHELKLSPVIHATCYRKTVSNS